MRSPILTAVLLLGLISVLVLGGIFLLRGVGLSAPAELLPADTLALLEARDAARIWRALARTRLGEEAEDGTSPIAEALSGALAARGLPLSIEDIDPSGVPAGELALALVPARRGGGPEGHTDMVLMLRAGHLSGRAVDGIGHAVRERLLPLGGAWGAHQYRGREYETLRLPGGRHTLAFAALRGVAIVTESSRLMLRLIDTLEGGEPSLHDDPVYGEVRRRMDQGAEMLAYASGEWVRRRVVPSPEASPGARRIARFMGIEAVQALGLEVELSKGWFEERLFVPMGPAGRGLPGKLFDQPPRARPERDASGGRFPYHLSISFSRLDAVYDRLPTILGDALGVPPDDIRERLRGVEELLAIDPDRELLESFGDRASASFGSASRYPRGAANRALQNMPAVITIETRRAGMLRNALKRLDGLGRMLGAYRSETLTEGTRLTWYDLPSLAPLRPSWSLDRGRLLAATSPELLRRLEAGGHAEEDRREAQEPTDRLPRRAHLVFTGETTRLLDLAGGGSVPAGPLQERLDRLRSDAELPGTAVAVTMTPEGLRIVALSPVSPSLLALMLAARPPDEPAP